MVYNIRVISTLGIYTEDLKLDKILMTSQQKTKVETISSISKENIGRYNIQNKKKHNVLKNYNK